MANLYSLEFFIEKIELPGISKSKMPDLTIQVSCTDLLNFNIKYKMAAAPGANNIFKPKGQGKAVFFATTISNIINNIQTNLKASVAEIESPGILGIVPIRWMSDFEERVTNLKQNIQSIEHSDTFKMFNDQNVVVGTMRTQLCLASHGMSIEVPINYLGSLVSVPLDFRATKRKTVAETIAEEDWQPMFITTYKPKRSLMDPGMVIFAEMAGIKEPMPINKMLTPEYINKHLCGHRGCPGARKFKEYGLGPLATNGSSLGTISSIKNAKPCGLYGMSQAYGTMENYGAYGLFVKKPKKPKACCGSPDCPYTAFYGKEVEEELPTTEALEETIKEILYKSKYKKCTCRNCRKNGNSSMTKPINGCGKPNCPNSNSKEPKCAYLNTSPPRQCAGADKYNSVCPGNLCPFSGCQKNGGARPKANGKGYCRGKECPLPTSIREDANCEDKSCLANQPKGGYTLEEEEGAFDDYHALCAGKTCPLDQKRKINNKRSFESDNIPKNTGAVKKPRKLSLLVNEEEKKLLYTTNPVPQQADILTTVSFANEDDMYYLISRIAENQTCNVLNYYNSDGIIDSSDTATLGSKDPKSRCAKHSCKLKKYKTHSDDYQALCGGKKCPLDQKKNSNKRSYDLFEDLSENTLENIRAAKKPRKLSLLVNEEEKKLLYTTNPDPQQAEYLTTVSFATSDDMNYLISRIAENQATCSLMNYYGQDGIIDSSNSVIPERPARGIKDPEKSKGNDLGGSAEYLTTVSFANSDDMKYLISRLAENQTTCSLMNYYSPEGILDHSDTSRPEAPDTRSKEPTKSNRKSPCTKDTCKMKKYKTCSECGGISKSGATCDNTNVSFATISYDSVDSETVEQPQLTVAPAIISKTRKETVRKVPDRRELTVRISKKSKRNSRFAYGAGENYPKISYGHKVCITGARNVPATMGWLWNVRNEGERKRKKTWRPGVIRKDVEERIIEHRREKGIPDPPELKMLLKKTKTKGYAQESESEEEEIEPKPTLIVEKKEGNYLITMNPLKDPKTVADNENPYIRCKPMQFLITKPKKEPRASPYMNGFEEFGEDEDFENYYNSCLCDSDANSSSSSDSELNIEFTTPAGIIIPERMKKMVNVVHQDTQFKIEDFTCQDCTIIVPKKFKKDKRVKKK